MKKNTGWKSARQRISLLLAVLMILSPVCGLTAFAGALGDSLHTKSLYIGNETMLANGIYWNSSASDKVTENYIVYEPGSAGVIPIIAYGNDIYGAASFSTASKVAETELGSGTVLAGINGDYFTMANGVPQGIEIKDGVLYTSETPSYPSLGFYEDGTAIIGSPALNIKLSGTSLTTQITSLHLNKVMTTACGVVLYTDEFGDDDTNKASIPTYNVLVQVEDGEIEMNGTLSGTVYSAAAATGSTKIPSGMVLLSMATGTSYTYTLNQLKAMKAGDSVTLDFTANEAWNDVTYGIGAGEKIVTAGANVAPMTTSLQTSLNPRTAVGIKSDGTLVFYTLDGRQSGYSRGATLSELAKRMIELGCVEAVNMDGGGSTAVHSIYPGDSLLSTINSPSEGTLRSCANYIMLYNTESADGDLAHLHPYPYDLRILAGATQSFTLKATDEYYYPTDAPDADDIEYNATNSVGSFDDNGVFTAGTKAASGVLTFSDGDDAEGTATVSVVTKPDSISIVNEADASATTAVSVAGGNSVNLAGKAIYNKEALVTSDSCFTWSVSGNIGMIDDNGVFTAAKITSGSGVITAAVGGVTASVNVTITSSGQTLENFEGTSSVIPAVSSSALNVVMNTDLTKVKFGYKSASVAYDFTEIESDAISIPTTLTFTTAPDTFGLWVYGDQSGNTLDLLLSDASGLQELLVGILDFSGWKQLIVDLPDGTTAISALKILGTGADSGTIYLDQLMRGTGYYIDTVPPSIQMAISGQALTVTVSDLMDTALSLANMKLTYDGNALTATYDATTKKLTATLPASDGNAHKVTLSAADRSGNAARATMTVAASAAAVQPFADMTSHWAKDSTAYLYHQEIVKGSGSGSSLKFSPDANITRSEFTVIISRWIGADESKYSNVVLPFADASSIPSWALGAVKAMYATGIIKGTGAGNAVYFNPGSTISREEVMTIIGRTQPRGYAEANLSVFSDSASVSSWAQPYVKTLVQQQIVTGYDGGLWPKKAVTRAQIATMIYKLN